MARMVAPYTGVIHDVDDAKVAARLAKGFRLIDAYDESEPVAEDAGDPVDPPDKPTGESTIQEIRAYAKAAGIDLPKGNKASLLEALGVA